MADKVEKTFLKFAGILAGGVEPTVGFLGIVAVNHLTKATTIASIAGAKQVCIKAVIDNLIGMLHFSDVRGDIWLTLINSKNYNTVSGLAADANNAKAVGTTCLRNTPRHKPACYAIFNKSKVWFGPDKQAGIEDPSNKEASIEAVEFGKISTTSTNYYIAIVASFVAIIVIVLVMVVIYFILRYRRKKK